MVSAISESISLDSIAIDKHHSIDLGKHWAISGHLSRISERCL